MFLDMRVDLFLNIYNLICFIYVYQFDILFYSFLLLKKREKASDKKKHFFNIVLQGVINVAYI